MRILCTNYAEDGTTIVSQDVRDSLELTGEAFTNAAVRIVVEMDDGATWVYTAVADADPEDHVVVIIDNVTSDIHTTGLFTAAMARDFGDMYAEQHDDVQVFVLPLKTK